MASPLYIPPSAELTTVQMVGPTGTQVLVNLHEIDDFRRQGYTPIGGGEKIIVNDTGTSDPETAYSKAGNEAFAKAKSEGKSDEEAGVIARKAAKEAEDAANASQKSEQPVGWLDGEDVKLAKVGDAREPWQIAGDDAFKAALDGGKSVKQASNAAYKAAKAVEGSPLK